MKYIKLIAEKTEDLDCEVNMLGGSAALHLVLDAYKITFASEINAGLKNFHPNSTIILDEDCAITKGFSNVKSMSGCAPYSLTIFCTGDGPINIGGEQDPNTISNIDFEKSTEIIKFFLNKKATINCQNSLGMTPFYMACLQGNLPVMKLLKDSGADINKLNAAGFHPIHGAVHNGHTNIIEELLKFGVSIDTKSTSGYTPLQYYCEQPGSNLAVVQFLLAKEASLNCMQGDNQKALLYSAVIGNNPEIVDFLIKLGANVNVLTTDKVSPLYCSMGYYGQQIKMEMLNLLISKGADVNYPMYDGDTPMHMSGYRSRVDIMEMLLSKGANINAKNHDGKTALNLVIEKEGYATAQQKVLAARYLLNHGGIIGKGTDEAAVGEFLGMLQSFTGPDEVLVLQENIIQCLAGAKQALTLPAPIQVIAGDHDMPINQVELGLTGDLSPQDS